MELRLPLMWPNRLVRASFQAWCLSTTSRAGASSTLRRPVGLRITAISRSALTSMNVRARAIRMTSPQKCAPMAALRTPKWSAIPMLR